MKKNLPFISGFFSQHNIFRSAVGKQKITRLLLPLFFIVLFLGFAGKGWGQNGQNNTFTTTGNNSITIPSTVTKVTVEAIGGGGGGGGSQNTGNYNGGGGGGGAYQIQNGISVTAGATYSNKIVVGGGGTGGAKGFAGGNGVASSVDFGGTIVTADYGRGGSVGSTSPTGGSGGTGTYNGGTGQGFSGSVQAGNGGGGSGGSTGAGSPATASADGGAGTGSLNNGDAAGAGGCGSCGGGSAPHDGIIYGGGGGGGTKNKAGAGGAGGIVVVSWPVISSFSPTSACTGSSITLTGYNLGGATSITFNGVAGTITANTSTSITVTISAGATTGLIQVSCTIGQCYSSSNFTINSPSITSHPSTGTQTICNGGSITALSVTASGSGLTYQWYRNTSSSNSGGTIISGANSSSYTPSNSLDGTYYYYCVVGGTCTPDITSNVSGAITVNPFPAAVTVSGGGTFCSSNTTITASNGSDGTIYYQGTTSGGTSIAAPSNSQVISASGTYYFRAHSNGCWGTEGSATVAILTPVSIDVNPTNQPYCVGGTANFSVTASGSSLSYQWQYSSDGITWNNVVDGTPAGAIYTNAATATMTVGGITAAGTYYYRCIVSNTCSNDTSNSATLTVSSTAPTISGTTTVCVAYTTTLTASITPGTWSSSNTGIATVDASGVVTGVTAGPATITYTVTASGCKATASVTVTATCPPANDACANAKLLPCGTTNMPGTTVNSVSENFPLPSACKLSRYGVWYTFPGNNMGTTISVTSSTLDIKMHILSGSCGSFTNIVCIDATTGSGTETYTFSTISGTTYYIYIAYYSSQGDEANTGAFTISRSTCDALCTSPSVTVADATDTNAVTMTANASGGSGGTIAYKWYSGTDCSGTAISGATNSTYSATATGNYSCKPI